MSEYTEALIAKINADRERLEKEVAILKAQIDTLKEALKIVVESRRY